MENPQYYREDEVDSKFNEKLVSSVNIKTINGSSVLGAGNLTINNSSNYKVYVALLTQTGTDAPTAIVLENTLGGTVVWTRNGTGYYKGTLSNAFPSTKSTVIISNGWQNSTDVIKAGINFPNEIVVSTYLSNTLTDGLLNNSTTSIEIRVYNSEEIL